MSTANLSELLKWGIQNSETGQSPKQAQDIDQARSTLNTAALEELLGGPSDADRMRDAMTAIQSPEVNLDNKLIAFDNFEQLVEHIDNANNMENLGLWDPLVEQLQHEDADMRKMAAWCLGTAVQNNVKAQERLLIQGTIPTLVKLAIGDPSQAVRKKAILALSSGVRNYQPGFDVALQNLPNEHKVGKSHDASDMEAVDEVLQKLRDSSEQKG